AMLAFRARAQSRADDRVRAGRGFRYADLPSMTVGLISVNLATSARTSAIPGSARAAVSASDEANWKWAIIANGAGEPPIGTPSIRMTLAAFITFIASGMWVDL